MADEKKDRQSRWRSWMKFILTAVVTLIVLGLIIGACNRWLDKKMSVEAENYRLRQELKLRQDQESGLWIPGQPSRTAEYRKRPSETKLLTPDGNIATHRLNCSDFPGYTLTRLKPGESAQVRHVVQQALARLNHCSFSITGAFYPIHAPSVETVPKWQNDMPFGDVGAHKFIVFLVEPERLSKEMFLPPDAYNSFPHKHFMSEGGVLVLTNNTEKEMLVVGLYNYGKSSVEYSQTGYDGSSITLETVKYFASQGQSKASN